MKIFTALFLFICPFIFAQQSQQVDFKTLHATVEINPIKRNVVGKCNYTFDVVNKKTDTIRIDAQKMVFTNVKINNSNVKFKESKTHLLLFTGFRKGENTLTFEYEAFPTQTMYFVNWDFTKEIDTPEEVNGQIWTQGQGKNTSHWLPSFDDANEKVVFNLDVTFQKSFEVVSNGTLLKKIPNGENITWQYRMNKPMSSYLVMVAIGHFEKQQLRAISSIPLENYYEKGDENRVEPTYRYSTQIFDFLVREIGVQYPWEIYRQIPVHDFLYAGMENTSSTLFSREFVVDSIGFNDHNFINVGAHELAHQWFGNMVTAKSGKHHWLQEGFATYYALLAEREIFGDEYFYNKLYSNAQQLAEASKTDTIPLLSEKASSLTYYQKGAWALHVIRESVGRENFNMAVKNYLEKFAFQNVSTDDFLAEVSNVATFDAHKFKETWLEKSIFPTDEVDALLEKNELMKQYIKLRKQPLFLTKDRAEILRIINSEVYYPIKEMLIYQSVSHPFDLKKEVLSAALNTNNLHVRQAVASALTEIPESFRAEYETLLNDKSYETQEIALFNLWKQFPEHRKRYLEVSKDWEGFQNKNLRLLHLSLAFVTLTDQKEKVKIYQELLSYTGTNFDSSLQQQSLEKMLSLEFYTEPVFRSLAYGLGNHRWQFVKFCKDNIRKLIKEKKHRDVFIQIRTKLPVREKTQLQRLLEE